MEKREHIVILAAGDFPTRRELISALLDADYVVCCDSAYEGVLSRFGDVSGSEVRDSSAGGDACVPEYAIHNCFVVGDGDSLPDGLKQSLDDRWVHVGEQNFNDLHKAMSWAASKFEIRNSKFTILGATGKREDHTLGNISYLVTFAEEYSGVEMEMLTDYGRFTAFRGRRIYDSFAGQQVSIFSMEPEHPLFSRGLKWELDGLRASRWWQASLNEALADSFELSSEGWTVVFQSY